VIRGTLQCLGLCLVLMLSGAGHAEVVKDLYSAQVPVADRSSQALASAARDALAQVLVKVSGSADALDSPVVKDALPGARGHVQQYGFVREEGPDSGLYARFEFDASYITGLVNRARLPLWTANRPLVLVWAAVDRDGERQFVSHDSTPRLARELLEEFDRRGVPAQLPLYDLADATAISVDDVWNLDAGAVVAASVRYDAENVLFGRVVALSTGEWAGDWSYVHQRDRLDRTAQAPESRIFARDGANLVADSMAARYAVASSGAGDTLVPMSVVGVRAFSDYAAIVAWLEGLELIDHANVQHISGDRIELGLVTQADAAQLASIIELNDRLVPQTALSGQLDYLWQN
jgi:uncharacterized protein